MADEICNQSLQTQPQDARLITHEMLACGGALSRGNIIEPLKIIGFLNQTIVSMRDWPQSNQVSDRSLAAIVWGLLIADIERRLLPFIWLKRTLQRAL